MGPVDQEGPLGRVHIPVVSVVYIVGKAQNG